MKTDYNSEFESARIFEPMKFGNLGDHVGTLRFLPTGGIPSDTIHTSTRVTNLFEPGETGILLLDIRPQDYPEFPVAEVKLDIDGHNLSIMKTVVCASYHHMGLIAYLTANAQNATDWRYPLTGVEYTDHW